MRKNSEKYIKTKDYSLRNGKKGGKDYGYDVTPAMCKSPNQDELKIKTEELEQITKK